MNFFASPGLRIYKSRNIRKKRRGLVVDMHSLFVSPDTYKQIKRNKKCGMKRLENMKVLHDISKGFVELKPAPIHDRFVEDDRFTMRYEMQFTPMFPKWLSI